MSKNISYLKVSLIAILIGVYSLLYVDFPHTSFVGSKTITITKGQGSRLIGAELKKDGFIVSKWAFVTYVTFTNTASYLRPGSYVFTSSASIPDIVKTLASGEKNEIAITIPEGWNIRDIAAYFDERGIVAGNDYLVIGLGQTKPASFDRFTFLKDPPRGASLEGFLFPDTYRVFRDATAEDIAIKMLDNFDRKVTPDMRRDMSAAGHTLFQVVTAASLIEKEVVSDEDRAIVAGILWKRLREGMPLQIDATISYITGNHSVGVSIDDTKIDSPYNTYKYVGLPKGPISNPGIAAIKAAVYPKESKYYYYLSTPDGRTIFSQTLDEHNIAKAKYLKN